MTLHSCCTVSIDKDNTCNTNMPFAENTLIVLSYVLIQRLSVLELKVCYKLKAFFAMPNIQVTSQTVILFLAVGGFSFQTNPYITMYVSYQSFILKGLLYIYDQVPSCLFVSPAVLFGRG